MLMKYTVIFILIFFQLNIYGQQATISGTVTDKETGEFLIAANVYEPNTLTGAVTNYFGFYSLKLPLGKTKVVVSYVGYQSQELEIDLLNDMVLNVELNPVIELEEVVITDESPIQNMRSTQMSMMELPVKDLKNLPVLLGEVDIIKSLQLMPGIQGGSEGSSGLYVRGGGPDQNLYLLDGVPVYNVNHLFGFFSVFNADAIKKVSLYKGGFPARFGERLSSVVDIRLKEGNMKEFKAYGSIGLLASNLTLEGPIIKDKTSFIVSGRRSYYDLVTYPFQIGFNKLNNFGSKISFGYFFQDLSAKINHKFSDKSRLYFSTYFGKDKAFLHDKYDSDDETYLYSDDGMDYSYSYKDDLLIKWGNRTAALRWNYLLRNNLFSNITATYSDYEFKFGNEWSTSDSYTEPTQDSLSLNVNTESTYSNISHVSRIKDIALKADFDYSLSNNQYIRFGVSITHHIFNPGVYAEKYNSSYTDENIDTSYGNVEIVSNEVIAYVEDEFKIGGRLKINAGLHYSGFLLKNTQYHSVEPRISGRFLINDWISFKASYVDMQQYLHLLAFSTVGLPTDLWVPSTKKVKPEKSSQVAAGFALAFNEMYEITIEGFYKNMENMVEYKEGAGFFSLIGDWETQVTTGDGESYGSEILIKKSTGKTTGWIGYTLAWANRTFPEISFGNTFPYAFDRRHDLAIVVSQMINDRISAGATWIFGTGYPFTLADERYTDINYILRDKGLQDMYTDDYYYPDYLNKTRTYFSTRNSYRKPNYHRLDVNINFVKQKKWFERTLSIGVYNLYARNNPIFITESMDFNEQKGEWETKLKKFGLSFPIPSINYSVKF